MLLQNFSANIVFDSLGDGVLFPFQPGKPSTDCVDNSGLHDQLKQTHAIERRNLSWRVRLDIGIDQVTHVGFVSLEIECLAAGLVNHFPNVHIVFDLLFDAADVFKAIAGLVHFVSYGGVGTDKRHSRLIKRDPLRFSFLQVGSDLGVATEIVNVLQFVLWRLYRLASLAVSSATRR